MKKIKILYFLKYCDVSNKTTEQNETKGVICLGIFISIFTVVNVCNNSLKKVKKFFFVKLSSVSLTQISV